MMLGEINKLTVYIIHHAHTKNISWNILTWYHILLDTMYRLLVVM